MQYVVVFLPYDEAIASLLLSGHWYFHQWDILAAPIRTIF
jgi:hypothetical protein